MRQNAGRMTRTRLEAFSDGVIAIIARDGPDSLLARALGRDWKGKLSPVVYLVAIPLALVNPWISSALYVLVALWWLIPDRRIERVLQEE